MTTQQDILTSLLKIGSVEPAVRQQYVSRIAQGKLTRDEDPLTHICVYFAGFDPSSKRVFIGRHIKSGLWLFNGGHMDEGEVPEETLAREMQEEWGHTVDLKTIGNPRLFSLTDIERPEVQTCELHYDIWYFVPLSEGTFAPDQKFLEKEFYETAWMSIAEAHKCVDDPNTLEALGLIEESL